MRMDFKALALAAVVLVLGVSCGSGRGPLQQRPGSAANTSARLHLGDSTSIGVIDLDRYGGEQAAVFDSVTPNEPVEGVVVLGYDVVLDPGDGIRSVDGFPPPDYRVEPLRGFSLAPDSGPVQVVVGLKLVHEGVHHIDGFILRYHVGSKPYELAFHEGASVCSFGFNAC